MKNVFLEVINSVNLVNKKMNDNMKSLFSKYIKLLAVILLSVVGVGQAWAQTWVRLDSINFTNTTNFPAVTYTNQSATVHGVFFKAKSSKNVKVNNTTPGVDFDGTNLGSGDHGIAIPVTGVNGSLKVIVYHDYNNTSANHRVGVSHATGNDPSASQTWDLTPTNSGGTKNKNEFILTKTDLAGTDYIVWVGESSSSYKVIKRVAIYTLAPDCTPISPTLSYASTSLTAGGSNSATPTLSGNAGGGTVTYSISATPAGCATINPSTGVVTPVNVGTATVTATIAANGVYCAGEATKNFTINCASQPTTLAISGATEVEVGSTTTLTVNNTGDGYGAVTWSSGATGKATVVNNTGVVTGVSTGAVTITANQAAGTKYCASSATHDMTVVPGSCTAITPTLSYTSTDLTVGGGNSATPTVSGNTGSGAVTYSSSNTSVATVDASGVVTPVAAGSVTITASIDANGGYCAGSATANFTVAAGGGCVPTTTTFNFNAGNSTGLTIDNSQVSWSYDVTNSTYNEIPVHDSYFLGMNFGSTSTGTITVTTNASFTDIGTISFNSASTDNSNPKVAVYIVDNNDVETSVQSNMNVSSGKTKTWRTSSYSIDLSSSPKTGKVRFKFTTGSSGKYAGIDDIQISTICTSCDAAPSITGNLSTTPVEYSVGDAATPLSVTATNCTLTYQWYSSTDATRGNGDDALISGATSASYTPSTAAVGTTYYYCKVHNNYNSGTDVYSNLAQINVTCSAPANPTISDATDDNKVTLTSDAGTTIYYTTDGSNPTTSSASVTTGNTITITADCTVKAFAKNACGESSSVVSKPVTFNPCAIETMVWQKKSTLPDGSTAPNSQSKFSAHSSVLSAAYTGSAEEGSSLNAGSTAGSIVKISLVNPANVMDYVKFRGKIEDASLQYSTDEGANWTTLASTNTGGDATYQLTGLNCTSIWLKSTGSSGFWLRNMQIKVCEEACTPVTALSVSSSAASVTGGSGTLTITAANGNGGTIVPATPTNGTISAVDATHFTYTPTGVVTPTVVRLTFNQAKYSGYCAGSAYVDVTVNPNPNPDIYVTKGGIEVAGGSTVDFANVAVASDAATTTTQTLTFNYTNQGLNDLEVPSIVISGDAFVGGCDGTCPTVSNGDNSSFTVSTVAGLAPGTYNGTVTINSNDPDESPYTFNIRYIVVPKYNVTVQFKTTAGATVNDATATIDGTTTSTNPQTVLVSGGLQTITCTEPAGYAFHHWQLVRGSSSSLSSFEFEVTKDTTISVLYTASSCEEIAHATATSSTTMNVSVGSVTVTSASSTSDQPGDGHAVKLGTSGYLTITAKAGSTPIAPGDSIIVTTWSKGTNKTHGYYLHTNSSNGNTASSPTNYAVTRGVLNEDCIESDGTVKVFRASAEAFIASVVIKRCVVETVPQVTASITPANNSINVDATSNIVVTLPDDFYLGADCEALTHIENTDALTDGIKSQIVSNIKIYKFNEGTSSYDDVTDSFSGTAVGNDEGVTVTFTHLTPMSYTSQYRVEILNPGVSNELCDPAINNVSTFVTGEEPMPQITVKDNGDITTFPNGGTLNVANLMPADGYGDAVIKVYNTGTVSGTLDISNMTITGDNAADFKIQSVRVNGVSYSPSTIPGLTKGGYPAVVTIRFTKASGIGTYNATLNIASNSTTNSAYALNLIGTKIDFTLPYIYESGCTDPVADPVLGVRQDYTKETDVPSDNIIIGAGAEDSGADANVIPHYSLWSSLGGCSQNGESAVRVGDRDEGKAIHILAPWIDDSDHSKGRLAIGKVTVKWAANGLRKISIENAAGVPFTQSVGWETSNECHTTTAFVNDCSVKGGTGTGEIYISVKGPEDGAMAAISYLEITPCDPEIKSTACDLINVTSANQQAGTSYTAQGTDGFIAVTDNCSPGETFTPTTLVVSNGATISPKAGVAQTINEQGYVTYVVTAADAMTSKTYHVYPECQPVLDDGDSYCYASQITVSPANGGDIYTTTGEDKKIAVVATASDPTDACGIVMLDANAEGGHHTVHYLSTDDIPAGGYTIEGPTSVCVGSTGTYKITNAPESNSPIYTWYIPHTNEAGFAVVGSEVAYGNITASLADKFGAKTYYEPQQVGEVLGVGQFVTATIDVSGTPKLMDIYSGPELKLLAPDVIESGDVSVALSLNFDFEDTNCTLLSGVASYSIKATSRSATPIVSVDAGCADENNRLVLTASQGSGDVIEATKLDWTFSDPDVNILVASGNSVTVNIGKGAPDIYATVIASNGCGTTDPNPTPIAVPYGTPATTWIGKEDNNWNNPANWTRQVPEACTDVTIAAVGETVTLPKGGNTTVSTYPVIPAAVPPATEGGICDEITFNRGAGVKGLENLSYRRAYVKNAYQRNKWYTLTNPLKEMVSGDYYFNGVPLTYMRKFDVTHSESRLTYTQKWTKEYNGLNEPLTAGQGFAYQVTNRNMRTPLDGEAVLGDQPVIFPRMTEDSLLITELHKFNPLTGKLMSATVNLTKTEAAYRFAYDNASVSAGTKVSTPADYSATISVPITAGEGNLSLIGNPMMCHLDLGAFLASNSSVIDGVATFWNGETNTSVAITTDGTVSTAAPKAGTKVAPMQAFFVKNKGAGTSVTFNVADHFVTDNGTYKLRSADAVSDGTLYVTGNDGETTSYLSVRKIEGASNGFAEGEDAEKIFNAYAVSEISTLAGGVATDINHFSALPYETPLAVNTTADKDTVDLTFKGAESFENVNVILVNKKTGEEINLKDENKYKFIFTKDEAETTLVLRFASDEDIATDAEQAEADASGCDVQIFTKGNNTVRVMSSSNNLIKEMSIFDAAGKLIAKEVATGNGVTVMDKVLNAGARNVVVTAVTDNCVKTEILQLK